MSLSCIHPDLLSIPEGSKQNSQWETGSGFVRENTEQRQIVTTQVRGRHVITRPREVLEVLKVPWITVMLFIPASP